MLNPLDIIVFDSTEVETAAKEYFGDKTKARLLLFAIDTQRNDDEPIVSVYLPTAEERKFYDESTCELADVIVKYSDLNYGDTAYIMF